MGPEFFQTMMGRKFYEADVPRVASALERIAAAMEEANRLEKLKMGVQPMGDVVKEFMEESGG